MNAFSFLNWEERESLPHALRGAGTVWALPPVGRVRMDQGEASVPEGTHSVIRLAPVKETVWGCGSRGRDRDTFFKVDPNPL